MKVQRVLDDATIKKLDRLGLEVVPKGTFREARALAAAAGRQHHGSGNNTGRSKTTGECNEGA